MRIRRFASLGLTVVAVTALAACSGGVAPTPTKDPRPTPQAVVAPLAFEVAPLTGEVVAAGSVNRPALSVKIDNHEDARPHIALNQTDIVFEELVEGGLTRYVAIWHSEVPAEVGPVRSIRPMDPDIITPFGGLVAYSGGQQQFVAMMQAAPVVNLVFDYDDTGLFYRADERPGPHDVILKAQEAVGRYPEVAKPGPQFRFAGPPRLAALPGTPTSTISLRFSDARYPSWSWDGATGTWLRSQEDSPDNEASGARIAAVNVVTMKVAIDRSYGIVPKTVMVGSGEAWVSTGGKTIKGTWSKAAQDQPIVLTAEDGTVLPLAPGNTWVELVPDSGSITFG